MGLTYSMFWSHKDYLLESEELIEERAAQIIMQHKTEIQTIPKEQQTIQWNEGAVTYIGKNIALGNGPEGTTSAVFSHFGCIINCSISGYQSLEQYPSKYLHVPMVEGKVEKTKLTSNLPSLLVFIRKHLEEGNNILIHSYQGSLEIPLCVALAVFLQFYDTQGNRVCSPNTQFSKESIRTMQYFVTSFCPGVTLSRVLLNDLNRFFMSREHGPDNVKTYWKSL